jgi:hypothetical protein
MSYTLDTSLSNNPPANAFAITKSDSADLPHVTRFLMVGAVGDVALITLNGDTVTLKAVAAGVPIPICARQVLSTNTTATGMVGLY